MRWPLCSRRRFDEMERLAAQALDARDAMRSRTIGAAAVANERCGQLEREMQALRQMADAEHATLVIEREHLELLRDQMERADELLAALGVPVGSDRYRALARAAEKVRKLGDVAEAARRLEPGSRPAESAQVARELSRLWWGLG